MMAQSKSLSSQPLVSVITTVYNGERYIVEAVKSLLNQTWADFELIVVNDGSTDRTGEILDGIRDERLVRLDNPANLGGTLGLAHSPNRALALAHGEFIARQDADDLSLPERLERQVQFLQAHPEVGLLGSWVELITEDDRPAGFSRPFTEPFQLKWELMFRNCFTQSSVMFRRSVIEAVGPYALEMKHAEDYELWWRISTRFGVATLPEVLARRRIVSGGVVATFPGLQREYAVEVVQRAFAHYLQEPVTTEQATGIDALMRNLEIPAEVTPLDLASLVLRLRQRYLTAEALTPTQQKWITSSAAEKLYILAGKAWHHHPFQAVRSAFLAEKLEARLPLVKSLNERLSRKL